LRALRARNSITKKITLYDRDFLPLLKRK